MLRQTTDFKKIFAMHTSDKESFPVDGGTVYNSINFKKTDQFKNGQRYEQTFQKEDVQMANKVLLVI